MDEKDNEEGVYVPLDAYREDLFILDTRCTNRVEYLGVKGLMYEDSNVEDYTITIPAGENIVEFMKEETKKR